MASPTPRFAPSWPAGISTGPPESPTSAAVSTAQPAPSLKAIEVAVLSVNQSLEQDNSYPSLEGYVGQGVSSDYDYDSSAAWDPFQEIKVHTIPQRILDYHDRAEFSTSIGLFAELNHAWISIDQAFYIWDYTNQNADIVGFEDQPTNITTVKLVKPRRGVFIRSITHLIVVATSTGLLLVGVESKKDDDGHQKITLYQTKMHVTFKSGEISAIEGSPETGRIFFGEHESNDIYELMYQQEEGWFQAKCSFVNHTSTMYRSLASYVPFGGNGKTEAVAQIALDDSRKLVYALSSKSTIRVFHMKAPTGLVLVITRTFDMIKTQISHMPHQTSLLKGDVSIVSISPISTSEAEKLNLVAVTSTGVRIFLSVTSAYGYVDAASDAPSSMQVFHVKFPPAEKVSKKAAAGAARSAELAASTGIYARTGLEANSTSLTATQAAIRHPPGYFVDILRQTGEEADSLFVSVPDCGLLAHAVETGAKVIPFAEATFRLSLKSIADDIGLVADPTRDKRGPAGYGNELAVQFDETVPELAVLTNNGVHVLRRRRIVDILASVIRSPAAEDNLDEAIKKFIRLYGRRELMTTALAIVCGQAVDVADSRISAVTDPDVIDAARHIFIEHGGRARLSRDVAVDPSVSEIDMVQPSPRFGGVAMYVSRLIRSVWQSRLVVEKIEEGTDSAGRRSVKDDKKVIKSGVPLMKLRRVQQNLAQLTSFLDRNKAFIEGLAGPDLVSRIDSKQDELALQGEHRAMHGIVKLVTVVIESISFALVLFENKVGELMKKLPSEQRSRLLDLTFQDLCCLDQGRLLARELVKAIMNRNISKGSSVEAVAEGLRRRCGSFCSADDVVIFKASEQLERASAAGPKSDSGRLMLNESLDLFLSVAGSLDFAQLETVTDQFCNLAFYGGSIRLILKVVADKDPGNRALSWIRDKKPERDVRRRKYEERLRYYELIQKIILVVDRATDGIDPHDPYHQAMSRRQNEAYDEANRSTDQVFQTTLFDWYLSRGWTNRLVDLESANVVNYLKMRSTESLEAANLLWQYYAHHSLPFLAAEVQYDLAKSEFAIPLSSRIEYLSRAKANASTRVTGMLDGQSGRAQRQKLLPQISELLEIALVQQEIMIRVQKDEGKMEPDQFEKVIAELDGNVVSVEDLFYKYADSGQYYDIQLSLYYVADMRTSHVIEQTWDNLISETHQEAVADTSGPLPFTKVAEQVRTVARRVNMSPTVFPITTMVRKLIEYTALARGETPVEHRNWAVDLLLQLGVPFDGVVKALEEQFVTGERKYRPFVALGIYYVLEKWLEASVRNGGMVFGGGVIVDEMVALLWQVAESKTLGLMIDREELEQFNLFRIRVEAAVRSGSFGR